MIIGFNSKTEEYQQPNVSDGVRFELKKEKDKVFLLGLSTFGSLDYKPIACIQLVITYA